MCMSDTAHRVPFLACAWQCCLSSACTIDPISMQPCIHSSQPVVCMLVLHDKSSSTATPAVCCHKCTQPHTIRLQNIRAQLQSLQQTGLHLTGWTARGRCIAVTQPRRAAAATVAARVAEEVGGKVHCWIQPLEQLPLDCCYYCCVPCVVMVLNWPILLLCVAHYQTARRSCLGITPHTSTSYIYSRHMTHNSKHSTAQLGASPNCAPACIACSCQVGCDLGTLVGFGVRFESLSQPVCEAIGCFLTLVSSCMQTSACTVYIACVLSA